VIGGFGMSGVVGFLQVFLAPFVITKQSDFQPLAGPAVQIVVVPIVIVGKHF